MISIITPTNNSKYLKETYESLKAQTFQDFEWIIVPNNEALKEDFSEYQKDSKIKIVPFTKETKKIGEIKKFAFSQGVGDWLVELDHDDILLPTALAELRKVLNHGWDFVYSNTADFKNETWESPKFNPAYGWQYREVEYQGHKLNEAISWEPNPQSLSLIYYAPNHFRAWKKEFYHKIGGHNENLNVADDHELCIRTYLEGKMLHINKCLYLYRIYGENAWLQRNAEIQTKTYELYNQYIYPLVERWCQINRLEKIDLGGRFNNLEGWESVDIKDAEHIMDLEKKWKFPNNSIGAIRANDILEHLKDPIHTMKEIYRVLAPNGWLLARIPSTDGRGAWQDPTHKSFWNQNSFFYWTRQEQAKFIDNKKIRFQVSKLNTFIPDEWTKQNNIPYVEVILIKLDNEPRLPGIIEI